MKIKLFGLFFFILSVLNINAQSYPLKVAILGNSITGNGPNPAIGWSGNWGMAASAKDKDFVRLIEKDLKAISKDIEVKELNIAGFERDYQNYNPDNVFLKGIKDFKPDILIIRLGENVDEYNLDFPTFHNALQNVIKYVADNRSMKVIATNSFWSSAIRDAAFQSFTVKYAYRFVDLHGLYDDKTNTAFGLFANFNVADHPSDKGMQGIKDKIWKELYQDVDYFFCNNYKVCDYCQEGNFVGYLDKASCDSISGWVLDQNNLDRFVEVQVLVDDKPYINLLANAERPDIQKNYGENALKHGFKYAVPVGVTWKDGQNHTIKVKPCWKNAQTLLQSGKTVNCLKPVPPKVYVPDYVSGWISTECEEIIGWIYDKNDLSKNVKIDFMLNDKFLKTFDSNQQRPDLLSLVTRTPDATKHTFSVSLPPLPTGTSMARIRLTETADFVGNSNIFQCPKVVLGTTNIEENIILIYPNPNDGEFKLLLPESLKNANIELFDSSGKEYTLINTNGLIKINGLVRGAYFLRVSKDGNSITNKIMVN